MVKVILWGGLRDLADGNSEFEFAATTIHKVFLRLIAEYPGLESELEDNVSVAVDGQIYRDSLFVSLPENAEVFILPKLQGG
ncbi:MAG: MoaD/ThiS family protein [Hyphomicrobiales bacterium]|nr:MoaD/ThiS family protein [Hyphomicrobiales bacterium]